MATGIPNSPQRGSGRFQKVVDALLAGAGLPCANILSAQRIEQIFAKHGGSFGWHGVYTTAVMVWSFLSQVCARRQAGIVPSCRGASRQLLPANRARCADARYGRLPPGRRTRTIDIITTLVVANDSVAKF